MKTITRKARFAATAAGILLAALTLGGPTLRADELTITLDDPTITVTAGETDVTMLADLTNTTSSPGGVLYLNGITPTVPAADSVDDGDFYTYAPLSLDPGDDSGTFALFTFDVLSSALPGDYIGTVDIFGGDTDLSSDIIGSQAFTVDVVATPEPSTLLLLTIGLLLSLAMKRKWNSARP